MKNKKISIAVIGMGYVGLPLANELSKKFNTIGYDINEKRINQLNKNFDNTGEIKNFSKKLSFTSKLKEIKFSNFYILCLPTPVNERKKPNLELIKTALNSLKKISKKDDTIVIESTYHPGTTKKLISYCFKKKLKNLNIGYSPERINPGDKKNTLKKMVKVISANNNKTLTLMEKIYGSINKNNIFKAKSIEVAEAAKLIENVQRDLNIGLMNELTNIFDKINVSINDVLEAANTKWNFLNFKPGLVGGHCIGVDPYYLKSLCADINFKPKVFISARDTNERMIMFYKSKIQKIIKPKDKVLFLGITFKENTNDLRNSKYLDLLEKLSKKCEIFYFDPLVKDLKTTNKNIKKYKKQLYDVIIYAIPHKKLYYFLKSNLNNILKNKGCFVDFNRNVRDFDKKRYKYIDL